MYVYGPKKVDFIIFCENDKIRINPYPSKFQSNFQKRPLLYHLQFKALGELSTDVPYCQIVLFDVLWIKNYEVCPF
jgi:hypothetical protein